jgi:cytochrome c biogenesis protein CcmG/thiol:disulfide interchange protein DsbE
MGVKRLVLWVPLLVFAAFVATVALGLYRPSEPVIRSKLLGKPVPEFALPRAVPGKPALASTDLASGQPRLVNVFASWCIPCIAEAPQLAALKRRGIPIDAVAIRDRPEDVAAFLDRWGDPFQRIGFDRNSSVQLALGSSGVPETFVIDGEGIIRHQHVGEIRPEHVPGIVRAYEAAR